MTSSTSPCDRDRIRLLVEQSLSATEQLVVEGHLGDCAACRAALDEMVADAQAWSDARSCLPDVIETDPHGQSQRHPGLLPQPVGADGRPQDARPHRRA